MVTEKNKREKATDKTGGSWEDCEQGLCLKMEANDNIKLYLSLVLSESSDT